MRPRKRILLLSLDGALTFALNNDVRLRARRCESFAEMRAAIDEGFDPEVVLVDNRKWAEVRPLKGDPEIQIPAEVATFVIAERWPESHGWPITHWISAKQGTYGILDAVKTPRKRGPAKEILQHSFFTLRPIAV